MNDVLGDLNTHVGNNAVVWKGVIDRRGDADVNNTGWILLQLWCNNALCTMYTFFQHSCAQAHLVQRFFGSVVTR